jgi:hypothetical protein
VEPDSETEEVSESPICSLLREKSESAPKSGLWRCESPPPPPPAAVTLGRDLWVTMLSVSSAATAAAARNAGIRPTVSSAARRSGRESCWPNKDSKGGGDVTSAAAGRPRHICTAKKVPTKTHRKIDDHNRRAILGKG